MRQKNIIYPDIDINLVLIHGVLSDGSPFDEMAKRFKNECHLKKINLKISVIKYGKLLLSVGRIPFVRRIVSDYIGARLAVYTYKYPNAKTVVIAHSFGTWAIGEAIKRLFKEFRVDVLILVGSVISMGYDWSKYNIKVHNFVGQFDWVVFLSALWGTGWSGLYGFKNDTVSDNIINYFTDWKHTDYLKGYEQYIEIIKQLTIAPVKAKSCKNISAK